MGDDDLVGDLVEPVIDGVPVVAGFAGAKRFASYTDLVSGNYLPGSA